MRKKNIKIEDIKLGCIFFVPFMNSDLGAFGYVKYEASTRSNSKSLGLSLCDVYDHVCRIDEWKDNIKQERIKISDMVINAGYFVKTKLNINPWILTNYHTDLIHPVIHGFFQTGLPGFEQKAWYDADAKNIIFPENINAYRKISMSFQPYNNLYVEAIFDGYDIEYGDPIPGVDC